MTENEPMTVNELLKLPYDTLVSRCKAWSNEFNNGKAMIHSDENPCPMHLWAAVNKNKCTHELKSGIKNCPVCDSPMCPDCMNHNVDQLSRVTGYMSNVGGWNAAKKQELKDRRRSNLKS